MHWLWAIRMSFMTDSTSAGSSGVKSLSCLDAGTGLVPIVEPMSADLRSEFVADVRHIREARLGEGSGEDAARGGSCLDAADGSKWSTELSRCRMLAGFAEGSAREAALLDMRSNSPARTGEEADVVLVVVSGSALGAIELSLGVSLPIRATSEGLRCRSGLVGVKGREEEAGEEGYGGTA